uniref:VWA domain-containing protein n=1 Tax=Plectus sambesii TaxID=2011161 RepID=A0A914XDQ3_9BILA
MVLKELLYHAQSCGNGDNTLNAMKFAIEQLAQEDADERFVIILSDANFERHSISPQDFSQLMTLDDHVNAFVIFLGSIDEQATHLKCALPTGKAFICKETAEFSQILRAIFTSTVVGLTGTGQD